MNSILTIVFTHFWNPLFCNSHKNGKSNGKILFCMVKYARKSKNPNEKEVRLIQTFQHIPYSRDINFDGNLEETSSRNSRTHPIDIYVADFSQYTIPIIQHHWHEKLQFMVVMEGHIQFEIAGETFVLAKGEGVFINSNVIHMSAPVNGAQAQLFSILFDTGVLGGVDQVGLKYILPIVDCPNLKYVILKPSMPWQRNMLQYLSHMLEVGEKQEFGFELEQKNDLGCLWLIFIRNMRDTLSSVPKKNSVDESRIKAMLEFIHKHYGENISLQEIADAAQLSKSECCRCFQRTLKASPFEYLIQVRISIASNLILNTDASIGQIAEQVGFNGLSYFHKTFKSMMHMTPMEFRKNGKNE